MIRPYLPRATLRPVSDRPRRGRPPSPIVAAQRSQVAALRLASPGLTRAEIAAELGLTPGQVQRAIAELDAAGLEVTPVAVAADGRRLARPITGEAPRWRIPADVVARLRSVAGVEDVGEAIGVVLDRLEHRERGT